MNETNENLTGTSASQSSFNQPPLSGAQPDSAAADMWERTKNAGRQAADGASEQYRRAKLMARDAYRQASDKGAEWEESLEQFVRRRPWTAILIGVGVGLGAGFALGFSLGEYASGRKSYFERIRR